MCMHTKKENTIQLQTRQYINKIIILKTTIKMAPVNCIVEGRWYTVPPMGCFILKEALCKSKIVLIWRHKMVQHLYYNESGCYQSEWVAPRGYI